MEKIARVYTQSLFEAAKEKGRLDAVREQLAQFAEGHNVARSVGRTGVCWDKGLDS